jgi:hypothetical protein
MDDILQQILESKILDWDPHGSRILGTTGHAVGESYEDRVNTDANIAALSTAIDRCNIACEDEYEAEEQKPKRGQPKKHIIQCHTKNAGVNIIIIILIAIHY